MGNIKQDDILPLFSQILNGVEAAHLSGVWHRDLKPENILFDQPENNLLVADFGIAHFEEEEIYTSIETRDSTRMANFQYSAPEQRVRNTKVDHRADIFSLGLILNELFTREILQGAGYKRIANINAGYAYLDELVELMTQQDPANRPEAIEKIKMELIGRRNAFIALQKYDETKNQVVSATDPPDFEPIKIISFDFDPGHLKLKLSRSVPSDWVQEFQYPRGGHSALMGYGPERYSFRGDIASIQVHGTDERYIQDIINNAKDYVNMANRNYTQQLQDRSKKEEQQQRVELEKKVADAELKKRILSTVKL